MVRTSSLFVFLPEPSTWPDSARPEPSTAQLHTDDSLRGNGPVRALVVLEVKEFSFFHLGVTEIVDVDPHDALAQQRGADAVSKLRNGLRNPPKYATLGAACGHVLQLLFGQTDFYMRSFEALVAPVPGRGPALDMKLLGKHTNGQMWHGVREEVAISPELACCSVETHRNTLLSNGVRVPVMMLQPFIPCDMDEGAAMQAVRDLMHEGKHKAYQSKRHRTEVGEIKGSSSGAGTSVGDNKKKKAKGANKKMTAIGRLVFLVQYYAREHESGTITHVHEVIDEGWRSQSDGKRVLKLRAIPSGEERSDVVDSDVVALDSQPSFERAWQAMLLSGDEARKLSLFHGCVRHAETKCKERPLFGVFRSLVPGTDREVAVAYAAEMEAATGRQKDVQPTDGGGAPSVTSQGEEESYRSGASPQSTKAGMSGTANTAMTAMTAMTAPAPNAEV